MEKGCNKAQIRQKKKGKIRLKKKKKASQCLHSNGYGEQPLTNKLYFLKQGKLGPEQQSIIPYPSTQLLSNTSGHSSHHLVYSRDFLMYYKVNKRRKTFNKKI